MWDHLPSERSLLLFVDLWGARAFRIIVPPGWNVDFRGLSMHVETVSVALGKRCRMFLVIFEKWDGGSESLSSCTHPMVV